MSERRITEEVRRRVRAQAGNRCGYCLSPQHLVFGSLEIEHIRPTARRGGDEEENLWLACRLCNNYKAVQVDGLDPLTGTRIALFNPRHQLWSEHFVWSNDGQRVLGLTPCGRATVLALRLNNLIAVRVREAWCSVGWHPPPKAP